MKTLSLHQPWASLVVAGEKEYETRSWSTGYRGPLAIHAAKAFPRWAKDLCRSGPIHYALLRAMYAWPEALPVGAVVGVVDLVEVRRTEDVRSSLHFLELQMGDYSEGRFAWRLENPRLLTRPVPAAGALGLWEWEPPRATRMAG